MATSFIITYHEGGIRSQDGVRGVSSLAFGIGGLTGMIHPNGRLILPWAIATDLTNHLHFCLYLFANSHRSVASSHMPIHAVFWLLNFLSSRFRRWRTLPKKKPRFCML